MLGTVDDMVNYLWRLDLSTISHNAIDGIGEMEDDGSGASDFNHTRATSEQLARLLPNARLVEPPWGDGEWNERSAARPGGSGEGLFVGWPLLAPALHAWADETALARGGAIRSRTDQQLPRQRRGVRPEHLGQRDRGIEQP